MSESTINVITEIQVNPNIGINLQIFTYYFGESFKIIRSFISQIKQIIDYIIFVEGELGILISDNSINCYVNEQGELILDGIDADKYSINGESGELNFIS